MVQLAGLELHGGGLIVLEKLIVMKDQRLQVLTRLSRKVWEDYGGSEL